MRQDFELNGETISFDFCLDANVEFFSVRHSWHYVDDIKAGMAKIEAAQNVRFHDYNGEFVINGVAYRYLCVEFRDIGDGFGSPYITAKRVDSWQDTLTDAARRQIEDNLVPKLRDFALANRENARAELLADYKQSALEKMQEAKAGFELAEKAIKAQELEEALKEEAEKQGADKKWLDDHFEVIVL